MFDPMYFWFPGTVPVFENKDAKRFYFSIILVVVISILLAELHNQGKQIALCKVPAHMGISGRGKQGSKTSNRYARDNHNKTTSYRLLPVHQEG